MRKNEGITLNPGFRKEQHCPESEGGRSANYVI